jgi:hypothetical protein
MMTAELTQASKTPVATDLSEMARSLAVVASLALDYPGAVKQVSSGFLEMAALARACGNSRIFMTSRALAAVLNRLDRAPEGDASFILDTVVTFLETVHHAHAEQDWRTPAATV